MFIELDSTNSKQFLPKINFVHLMVFLNRHGRIGSTENRNMRRYWRQRKRDWAENKSRCKPPNSVTISVFDVIAPEYTSRQGIARKKLHMIGCSICNGLFWGAAKRQYKWTNLQSFFRFLNFNTSFPIHYLQMYVHWTWFYKFQAIPSKN